MDKVKGADGHTRWILGPVEMSAVAAVPAVLGSLLVWLGVGFSDRLDQHSHALQSVMTEQARTTVKLETLTLQLADVPSMARRVAEHEVRLRRVEEDTRELRSIRGLD